MDYQLVIAASLGLMSLVQIGILLAVWKAASPAKELTAQATSTLRGLSRALAELEQLLTDLRQSNIISKTSAAVESLKGGAGRLDPLASQLSATLGEAKTMLDDATQTSQAVRNRVEDFAATQTELQALARALADVACELRDRELAAKLENVLADTSLLAADLGMLAENASSVIDGSKPLVGGISRVVDSARNRAATIARSVGSVREGIRAGSEAWKQDKK